MKSKMSKSRDYGQREHKWLGVGCYHLVLGLMAGDFKESRRKSFLINRGDGGKEEVLLSCFTREGQITTAEHSFVDKVVY